MRRLRCRKAPYTAGLDVAALVDGGQRRVRANPHGATSGKARRRSGVQLAVQTALALGPIVAGATAGFESPLVQSVALSALIGALLLLSLVDDRDRRVARVRLGEPLLAVLRGTRS